MEAEEAGGASRRPTEQPGPFGDPTRYAPGWAPPTAQGYPPPPNTGGYQPTHVNSGGPWQAAPVPPWGGPPPPTEQGSWGGPPQYPGGEPPRRKPVWPFVVIGAVILLAVAALVAIFVVVPAGRSTTTTTPTVAAGPPADPAMIGDEHSADPCSVTDTTNVARFGTVALKPTSDLYNTCMVKVVPAGAPKDAAVSVRSSFQVPWTSATPLDGPSTQEAGYTVLRPPLTFGDCYRTITLHDKYRIVIDASLDNRLQGADLCAVADAAVTGTLAKLTTTGIGRRDLSLPPTSNMLTKSNACTVLDAPTLAAAGFAGAGERGFGDWYCDWYQGPTYLEVSFGNSPPLNSARDGTPRTIGNRTYYVLPGDYPGYGADADRCLVQTPQHAFTAADGDVVSEMIDFRLTEAGLTAEARCNKLVDLAVKAVTGLPAPN